MKRDGVFNQQIGKVKVIFFFTSGNRYANYAEFKISCMDTLAKYAFGWNIYISGAVFFGMFILTLVEAARLVITFNYLYVHKPRNCVTVDTQLWFCSAFQLR